MNQALAHIAGGDAYNRVVGRIVRRLAAEESASERPFLQLIETAGQRRLHNKPKELLAAAAALERGTRNHLPDMRLNCP